MLQKRASWAARECLLEQIESKRDMLITTFVCVSTCMFASELEHLLVFIFAGAAGDWSSVATSSLRLFKKESFVNNLEE